MSKGDQVERPVDLQYQFTICVLGSQAHSPSQSLFSKYRKTGDHCLSEAPA